MLSFLLSSHDRQFQMFVFVIWYRW